MPRLILGVVLILFLKPATGAAQPAFQLSSDSNYAKWRLPLLPQNFYNQHLGFFCRKEDLIQKKIKLPVYFRLGSKAYVDYLEQKPNATFFSKH